MIRSRLLMSGYRGPSCRHTVQRLPEDLPRWSTPPPTRGPALPRPPSQTGELPLQRGRRFVPPSDQATSDQLETSSPLLRCQEPVPVRCRCAATEVPGRPTEWGSSHLLRLAELHH